MPTPTLRNTLGAMGAATLLLVFATPAGAQVGKGTQISPSWPR